MSAPLPEALRARFQKLIEEGLSGRAAALRLKLSPATGARWGLAIRRTGSARAAPGFLDGPRFCPRSAFHSRSARAADRSPSVQEMAVLAGA